MTSLFVVAFVVAAIAYDIIALALGGGDATISSVISSAAAGRPVIVFAMGMLAGHWFWPRDGPPASS